MPRAQNDFRRQIAATITRAEADNARRFNLSFSSEEPVPRWDGRSEILEHTEASVDLSRLNEIGVVLFNHNPSSVIARVEKAWVEDGRGCATILFDDDDAAETIRKKVESGTLKGVSVRGRVSVWEEVAANAKSADGRFDGPAVIAKRWMPVEISIVSIPADASVGVNRNYESEEFVPMEENERSMNGQTGGVTPAATPAAPASAPATGAVVPDAGAATQRTMTMELWTPAQADGGENAVQRAVEAETQRVSDIMDICRDFGVEAKEYIDNKSSVDTVRAAILEKMKAQYQPVGVAMVQDEGDKFREMATDAILLRGGIHLAEPTEGASDLRGYTLRELMNECARREGVPNPERIMDPIDLMRQYFTPTSAFPAILDQAINKAYREGYRTAPATFDLWTSKGTLTDFKPTKSSYLQGSAGELLLVPEGGELKHDQINDHLLPERKLNTYGRQFTLTREAIINDDIGFVTSLPARYAASARRTINKQVYGILATNPVIFDGTPLFGANHKNLVNPGTVPSMGSLQDMIEMLMLMVNDDGDPIAAVPKYIPVPIGLGVKVRQLISSPSVLVSDGNGGFINQNNPLAGMGLEVVEDAYLNTLASGSNIAWFLVADPTIMPTIQVDYLNGNEIPTIRRMEHPGQLGYIWDVYLDWGISVLDYRGIIKNPGANA